MVGFYNKNYDNEKAESKLKQIYFNVEKESDLLEFASSVKFSKWVKEKIKEEIKNKK